MVYSSVEYTSNRNSVMEIVIIHSYSKRNNLLELWSLNMDKMHGKYLVRPEINGFQFEIGYDLLICNIIERVSLTK